MGKNPTDRQGFPPNMIRLCIDGYNNDIQGRMYSKMNQEPIEFDNCCEMFLKADEMFDQNGYPQSFCDSRSFVKGTIKGRYDLPSMHKEPLFNDEDLRVQEGTLCTLDVLIRSRRQASWQGFIRIKGDSCIHEFHCAMELLRCIEKIIKRKNHNLQSQGIE